MQKIIILHGWGSSADSWTLVQNFLREKGYKVYVPSLPGFNEKLKLSKGWFINDYVCWLNNYCESEKIDKFILIGHSFGGAISVKYSLKYPEKVEKLFLLANSGRRSKSFKKYLIKKVAGFFKKFKKLPAFKQTRKFFYFVLGIKTDYLDLKEESIKETYLNVINEDISEIFKLIEAPTIIFWGKKDSFVPLRDAFFINKEIKNSELTVFPGLGHDFNREKSIFIAEKINDKIEKHE